MTNKLAWLLLVSPIFYLSNADSSKISQSAIYVRCHSQFVREVPEDEDRLLVQVREGKINAKVACSQLLDEARLGINDRLNNNSDRGRKILRTVQAFHTGWFDNKDFMRQEAEGPTSNIFDANEMGYHLTYSLLKPGQKYSQVVTREKSLRGLRVSSEKPTHLIDLRDDGGANPVDDNKWVVGDNKEKEQAWKPTQVQFGTLEGIAPMSDAESPIEWIDGMKKHLKFDGTQSLGGGILGTRPFIMLNHTFQNAETPDGGLMMYRSWSRAVFASLLCRDLPVIRESDAKGFVRPDSAFPFQKNSACMQCHATMDPMAAVIRNLSEFRTAHVRGDVFSVRMLAPYAPSQQQTDPLQKDYDYYLRPPDGELRYRNYEGRLVEKKVFGVQKLGEAIAEEDDLYICAAKRYFEFMTGIEVILEDFSQSSPVPSGSPTERYRKFVIKEGLQLKKHQSLRQLIKNIVSSAFYSQSDYGVSNE